MLMYCLCNIKLNFADGNDMLTGKEMARVKSLNVMGQRTNSRCQMDVGCTPQGPRLPAFSIPSDSRQQHLLSSTNSPCIRMLMAGSSPSSAYMGTPNFT